VPYGRNYDRDRLLSGLAVHPASHSLAVNDKGRVSAEIFIFCRYTMFSEVYWHHAVRAVEAMTERALEDFQRQIGLDGAALIDRLLGHSDESLLDHIAASGRDFARRVAKARVLVAPAPARTAREALGADALAERLLDALLAAADELAAGSGTSGRLF